MLEARYWLYMQNRPLRVVKGDWLPAGDWELLMKETVSKEEANEFFDDPAIQRISSNLWADQYARFKLVLAQQ
jgi:hypothetical protein